jgi:hypothetical protein
VVTNDDRVFHECDNFTRQECEPRPVPSCTPEVKEQCDTKWVVDPVTGGKTWGGNVNCRQVTWQNCRIDQVPRCRDVPFTVCREVPRPVPVCGQLPQTQTLVHDVCTVNEEIVCVPEVVPSCKTIAYQECRDVFNCASRLEQISVPRQNRVHLVNCVLPNRFAQPSVPVETYDIE